MVRALALSACLLACLLAALPARAERWALPDGSFAAEFPDGDGWKAVDVPPAAVASLPPGGQVVARRTADGRRAALLTVIPDGPEARLSDETVAGFEAGLFRDKPAVKLSGGREVIQGLPAYCYAARLPNGAGMVGVVTVRAGVTYHIQAISADGNPMVDPVLASYMESWRLP